MINRKHIAKALSDATGVPVTCDDIECLNAAGTGLPDGTLKFLVRTHQEIGFMIVSGAGNPQLVRRAVDNIEAARALAGAAGRAILRPIMTGQVEGRSFAVWKRLQPIESPKFGRFLLRLSLGNRILGWAHEICAVTARPDEDLQDRYIIPLAAVRDNPAFPREMRDAAASGLQHLGEWQPMQCVQHGDFWLGNVLKATDGQIAVIDWGGARIDGYPAVDLTRMLISLGYGRRSRDRHLAQMAAALSCEPRHLVTSVLAAIGDLGTNLEFFPVELYTKMSVDMFHYLDRP